VCVRVRVRVRVRVCVRACACVRVRSCNSDFLVQALCDQSCIITCSPGYVCCIAMHCDVQLLSLELRNARPIEEVMTIM